MKKQFIEKLIQLEFIKFGTFQLKSGKESNIYFDIRNIISYPEVIIQLTDLLKDKMVQVDRICGVPYGALSMATALSLETKIPQILKRKEAKSYGGKKLIDGNFKSGDKVLLIEDVVTSGLSLIETINELENVGLVVEKILVVLDRQEGGLDLLKQKGYIVESILTKEELLNITK